MSGRVGLPAPLPWKGGKARIAARVWELLGNVDHYVEPFAGMLSPLLARPPEHHAGAKFKAETVNDANALLVNFWRSVRYRCEELRAAADWPVSELDNTARLRALASLVSGLRAAMLADPRHCEPELAAWWALAHSQAIASRLAPGLPYLSGAGLGWQTIRRRNRAGAGVTGNARGTYLEDLEARLAHVRIVCGDYRRVLKRSVLLMTAGMVEVAGVYVDPPYGVDRYAEELGAPDEVFDPEELTAALRAVADELGPRVRIVVSGFVGSFDLGEGWGCETWEGDRGHYAGERPVEALWSYNAAPAPACDLFTGMGF